jgi:hypothetical protein
MHAAAHQKPAPAQLFGLARDLARAGEERRSAELFRRTYLLKPTTGSLLDSDLPTGDIAELRDYAAALISNGAIFSPVIAALAIAEAHLGNADAVRRLVDYDRFFSSQTMGASDPAAFNQALAAEIKADLTWYDEPAGRAIRSAWRHNHITESPLPALRRWNEQIRRIVERYMAAIPRGLDHPFARSRPAEYVLECWGLVSGSDSFHKPHIHPRAWMSGVYYVTCPPVARAPGSRRGWLTIGPPEKHGVSAGQGWDERLFAPEPGTLVMMPAYFYHWTRPMESDEERICLVFDVVPVELASTGRDARED